MLLVALLPMAIAPTRLPRTLNELLLLVPARFVVGPMPMLMVPTSELMVAHPADRPGS